MVVACLALFVASTGTSIAAKHYLITSTKQIKPSVIKKLKGAKGPRGATGAQGTAGATGVQGAAGATGAQGSSGIVTTGVFNGLVSTMVGNTLGYVFAGPTATVTTTASQRLTGAAEASLGSSASGSGQWFNYGLCYQPSAGGTITNFAGANFSTGLAYTPPRTFAATASVVPGAGTWKVGFCVENYHANNMDANGNTNGWVQVTN
jgi:hypothetical protein